MKHLKLFTACRASVNGLLGKSMALSDQTHSTDTDRQREGATNE